MSARRIKRKVGIRRKAEPTSGGIPMSEVIESQKPEVPAKGCILCKGIASWIAIFIPGKEARARIRHDIVMYALCDECKASPDSDKCTEAIILSRSGWLQ